MSANLQVRLNLRMKHPMARESGTRFSTPCPQFGERREPSAWLNRHYGPDLIDALAKMEDLPGVTDEAAGLKTLLYARDMGVRTPDDGPVEEAFLRSLGSPWLIHLASHAFALPPHGIAQLSNETLRSDALQRFPMNRSGIVLGPLDRLFRDRSAVDQGNDNILFAEEAGNLDLSGTWLVTLSACSTGRGDQVAGEGILGLQRGFFTAGARNVAMTLWPIADAYAPQFMVRFYTEALESERAGDAMWNTQRRELRRLENAEGIDRAVWARRPLARGLARSRQAVNLPGLVHHPHQLVRKRNLLQVLLRPGNSCIPPAPFARIGSQTAKCAMIDRYRLGYG